MKVSCVVNFINYHKKQDLSKTKELHSEMKPLVQDSFERNNSLSFKAIKSASNFRDLPLRHPVHCIYCDIVMFAEKTLNRLKSTGTFSKPIFGFVQDIFPYLKQLHESEKEVFKQITLMTFDKPDINLSEAIKILYPKANEALLQEQKPIIQEIAKLGKDLPYGWKSKFQSLMRITRYRLEDKSYIPPEFSGKEFTYKLKRMERTIKDNVIAQRILKLAEPLTHPIFKYSKEPLTEKFTKKLLMLLEANTNDIKSITKEDLQLAIINKIKDYATLIKRKDILYNCEIAENTIRKAPVKIKFSNRSFRYDLNEILEDMPNQELKKKMLDLAYKLPTSRTSPNAFITKYQYAASDAIGYNLLRPSLCTIEHLQAKSKGGANELYNYALACESCNNSRSNDDLSVFIAPFPIQNQINYFRDIFEEVKQGNLDRTTFNRMINSFFKQSGREIKI